MIPIKKTVRVKKVAYVGLSNSLVFVECKYFLGIKYIKYAYIYIGFNLDKLLS